MSNVKTNQTLETAEEIASRGARLFGESTARNMAARYSGSDVVEFLIGVSVESARLAEEFKAERGDLMR